MEKTKTNTQQEESALAKFNLFFEHTDDNRVVVNKQDNRPVKKPRRNIASKR
jgi:hypothetical protein